LLLASKRLIGIPIPHAGAFPLRTAYHRLGNHN
jgi:hypothetical protein